VFGQPWFEPTNTQHLKTSSVGDGDVFLCWWSKLLALLKLKL